jgi:hypothetical protein
MIYSRKSFVSRVPGTEFALSKTAYTSARLGTAGRDTNPSPHKSGVARLRLGSKKNRHGGKTKVTYAM